MRDPDLAIADDKGEFIRLGRCFAALKQRRRGSTASSGEG